MTEKDKQPKPKRQCLRFSLRTLLVVLTILCVLIGWYLYRVEQQREAVKWVLENGGTVNYDSKPSVPKWMLDMLGDDYFYTVTQVANVNTEVSDVTPLAPLKNLKVLFLSKTQVSDLSPLVGLTNLEYLRLAETQISDVTPLAGLTNLKQLKLNRTQVSDVTPLAGLTNLEVLGFSRTQVSDVTPLAGHTNLELLTLDGTHISDVTPLAGLTNLKTLALSSSTHVSDIGPWADLTKLPATDIRKLKVWDEGIEKLKQALPNCKMYIR